jgi:hypothetical protein
MLYSYSRPKRRLRATQQFLPVALSQPGSAPTFVEYSLQAQSLAADARVGRGARGDVDGPPLTTLHLRAKSPLCPLSRAIYL